MAAMTRLSLTLDPMGISHFRQKQKSCIWPSNEHFCQVWFKSVLLFQWPSTVKILLKSVGLVHSRHHIIISSKLSLVQKIADLKVCQWFAEGRWFSLGTPVSSTNKTDRHDITKILLKVAWNTITLPLNINRRKSTTTTVDVYNTDIFSLQVHTIC
jgi:hypothetical protein